MQNRANPPHWWNDRLAGKKSQISADGEAEPVPHTQSSMQILDIR